MVLNYGHLIISTPVSEHFNHADHSINDVLLASLEPIRSHRDPFRGSPPPQSNEAMTLEPRCIIRTDQLSGDIYLFSSLLFSACYIFKSRKCNVHLASVFIFLY